MRARVSDRQVLVKELQRRAPSLLFRLCLSEVLLPRAHSRGERKSLLWGASKKRQADSIDRVHLLPSSISLSLLNKFTVEVFAML